jgi:hypothetical protein
MDIVMTHPDGERYTKKSFDTLSSSLSSKKKLYPLNYLIFLNTGVENVLFSF